MKKYILVLLILGLSSVSYGQGAWPSLSHFTLNGTALNNKSANDSLNYTGVGYFSGNLRSGGKLFTGNAIHIGWSGMANSSIFFGDSTSKIYYDSSTSTFLSSRQHFFSSGIGAVSTIPITLGSDLKWTISTNRIVGNTSGNSPTITLDTLIADSNITLGGVAVKNQTYVDDHVGGDSVITSGKADGNVLKWSAANSRWQPAADAGASGGTADSVYFYDDPTGGTEYQSLNNFIKVREGDYINIDREDSTSFDIMRVQVDSATLRANLKMDSAAFADSALGAVRATTSDSAFAVTDEEIEDEAGAMVSGNTETGITVTYQDADGTIDFEVTLGTSIASNEIVDQTIIKDDIDTTASNFVFDDAYRGTSAVSDSQYVTKAYADALGGGSGVFDSTWSGDTLHVHAEASGFGSNDTIFSLKADTLNDTILIKSDGTMKFQGGGGNPTFNDTVFVNGQLAIGYDTVPYDLNVTDQTGESRLLVWTLDSGTATDHARIEARTLTASGGDPYFSATVGGVTNWSWGIDNSDNDNFEIHAADDLTGTPALSINKTSNVVTTLSFISDTIFADSITTDTLIVNNTAIIASQKIDNDTSLVSEGELEDSLDNYLLLAGGTMAGNINMGQYDISNTEKITTDTVTGPSLVLRPSSTGESLTLQGEIGAGGGTVDIKNGASIKWTFSGNDLSGSTTGKLVNLVDPSAATDGATKNYVDTTVSNYLLLSGGTMTGSVIGMDSLDLDSGLYVNDDIGLTGNIYVLGTVDSVDVAALGGTVPKITDDTTGWNAAEDSVAAWDNGALVVQIRDTIDAYLDTMHVSFCLLDTITATDDFLVFRLPKAITVIKVVGVLQAGTNVVGTFYEFPGTGDMSGTDSLCYDITFDGGADSVISFSNAVLDAGDWLGWKTTSVSGDVGNFTVTLHYTH